MCVRSGATRRRTAADNRSTDRKAEPVRHRKNLRVALATSVTLVAGFLAIVAVTASRAQAAPT
jgi:hypothetical protein